MKPKVILYYEDCGKSEKTLRQRNSLQHWPFQAFFGVAVPRQGTTTKCYLSSLSLNLRRSAPPPPPWSEQRQMGFNGK